MKLIEMDAEEWVTGVIGAQSEKVFFIWLYVILYL